MVNNFWRLLIIEAFENFEHIHEDTGLKVKAIVPDDKYTQPGQAQY